jgi:ribosomal protein S18 acetylase RimI-like enzyme
MTMFVRTASERDLAVVRALLVETWHATYDHIYGVERVTAITNDWHSMASLGRRLTRPNSEFLVADDGKVIAGMAFAAADPEGKVVMLNQLYVRPAFQGCGIGGMLLDEILDCFPDADTIRLEVEEANDRAIAFYKTYGFAEASRTGDCGVAGSGIPALVFERPLKA